jgi:2-iminobutanoate/2-iminopropanoate deaminase
MKKVISTPNAPAAVGPYSQAIVAPQQGLVYTAGQIALIPATGQMVSGGIQAETRQAIQNLAAVLEASGSGLDHVIKTTVFLTDMVNFQLMNAVYQEFFVKNSPARSAVAVTELPKKALVEIEAVALVSDREKQGA